jgi:hypothetical protein
MVMGNDLLSTIIEQAAYKNYYDTTLPMACPNDGTPLQQGPPEESGTLYCPFDFWQYPRDWNPDVHSGM